MLAIHIGAQVGVNQMIVKTIQRVGFKRTQLNRAVVTVVKREVAQEVFGRLQGRGFIGEVSATNATAKGFKEVVVRDLARLVLGVANGAHVGLNRGRCNALAAMHRFLRS